MRLGRARSSPSRLFTWGIATTLQSLAKLIGSGADVFSGSIPTPAVVQRHPLGYTSEEGSELSRQIGHGVAVKCWHGEQGRC